MPWVPNSDKRGDNSAGVFLSHYNKCSCEEFFAAGRSRQRRPSKPEAEAAGWDVDWFRLSKKDQFPRFDPEGASVLDDALQEKFQDASFGEF